MYSIKTLTQSLTQRIENALASEVSQLEHTLLEGTLVYEVKVIDGQSYGFVMMAAITPQNCVYPIKLPVEKLTHGHAECRTFLSDEQLAHLEMYWSAFTEPSFDHIQTNPADTPALNLVDNALSEAELDDRLAEVYTTQIELEGATEAQAQATVDGLKERLTGLPAEILEQMIDNYFEQVTLVKVIKETADTVALVPMTVGEMCNSAALFNILTLNPDPQLAYVARHYKNTIIKHVPSMQLRETLSKMPIIPLNESGLPNNNFHGVKAHEA